MEGTWRGVKYLIDQSETSAMLKIKVFNCNKRELLRDLRPYECVVFASINWEEIL